MINNIKNKKKIKPKIGLINFGCPKNLVDSENMLGILSGCGYNITLDEEKSDIVIINTCAFIKDAEKESVKTIVELAQRGKKIIIVGCLVQKHKKELQEAVPEALAFVGTGDIEKIGQIVDRLSMLYQKESSIDESVYEVSDNPYYSIDTAFFNPAGRFQITAGASSYIKIAEGCDYSCSFCVIPSLRGKYRSRTIESIVTEAKQLGEKGVSEVILIAQDTSSYGKDLYGKPSLPKLLEKLNQIKEISWIRVMYAYPSLVNDDFIKAIANLDRVVKYIDMPLQHSHPDILRLMKRPVIDNGRLIEKIRENIPDAALRTVFITGFPGEEEEHFQHLYAFIEKYRFDRLGIFEYSREKDTGSHKLKGHVNTKIKKLRKRKLMALQQGISRELNNFFIGKEIDCLIETIDSKGKITARSRRDAPEIDGSVLINSKDAKTAVYPGEIVKVKITGASEYDLFGVL